MRNIALIIFSCFAFTLINNAAHAACTAPVGVPGDLMYNATYDVFQGCTENGWYAFHEAAAVVDPCETGPIATTCADGAVYAGTSGGNRLYTTVADEGLFPWKTTQTTTAGTTSVSDGVANTDAMSTAGLVFHPAAQACRARGPEWYLPAQDELGILYINRAAIGGFNTSGSAPGGYYWMSAEVNATNAYSQIFQTGMVVGVVSKNVGLSVRCVRR